MSKQSSPVSSQSSSNACEDDNERLWSQTAINLDALDDIVQTHFQAESCERVLLGQGVYARAFVYTLPDDRKYVARVILPVRTTLKTEAEVAVMDFVRARTFVPVPRVYLYCNIPHNPVGAEWIIMELVPGVQLAECFDALTPVQQRGLATAIADIVSSLFSFTASHAGSLLSDRSLRADERSVRYTLPQSSQPTRPESEHEGTNSRTVVESGQFTIGPLNDVAFLEYYAGATVSASDSGPFASERQLLEAFAHRIIPELKSDSAIDREPYEKVFQLYDFVRPSYELPSSHSSPAVASAADTEGNKMDAPFHFTHGDLNSANFMVDPENGTITGVIDWEMAGFRPAWVAAAAGGWFDDDELRILMDDLQWDPENDDGTEAEYRHAEEEESDDDKALRAYFRDELKRINPELFYHYWNGVELRAIYHNIRNDSMTNVVMWLEKYHKCEWDTTKRGPFPFDVKQWASNLYEGLAAQSNPVEQSIDSGESPQLV